MAEDPDNTTYGPTLYGTYDPGTQRVVTLRIRNLQRTMTILSLQTVVVMLAVREQLMEAVLQRK